MVGWDGRARVAARAVGLVLALLCALIVLVDFLPAIAPGSALSGGARLAFRSICHQLEERSPVVDGHVLAACHRCTGIWIGFALGGLLAALGLRVEARSRVYWLVAVAPIALHVAASWCIPLVDHPLVRVATGLVFGALAGLGTSQAVASWFPSRVDRAALQETRP